MCSLRNIEPKMQIYYFITILIYFLLITILNYLKWNIMNFQWKQPKFRFAWCAFQLAHHAPPISLHRRNLQVYGYKYKHNLQVG